MHVMGTWFSDRKFNFKSKAKNLGVDRKKAICILLCLIFFYHATRFTLLSYRSFRIVYLHLLNDRSITLIYIYIYIILSLSYTHILSDIAGYISYTQTFRKLPQVNYNICGTVISVLLRMWIRKKVILIWNAESTRLLWCKYVFSGKSLLSKYFECIPQIKKSHNEVLFQYAYCNAHTHTHTHTLIIIIMPWCFNGFPYLSLSRYSFISFIDSGRFFRLHPKSIHSCCR